MSTTVRTSEEGWFAALAKAYKDRTDITLIDDAKTGIDPKSDSLISMARRAGISSREIAAVGVSLGLSATGVALIIAAVFDPEPTSKLGLLIGGGVLCVLGGSGSAIMILMRLKPKEVVVTVGPGQVIKISF
jgi:hypothetical protein